MILRPNPYWFWRALALAMGLVSAWFGRHIVNADGISYIEVGDAWLRGDWKHAINGYWSPLYSWMIALTKLVAHPTPYWEFACVHIVNFAFYIVSLACFERFLRRFLAWLETARPLPPAAQRLYRTLGYALFLWVGLFGVNLVNTTPDQMVAAMVYLACSLLLDIHTGRAGWPSYALLGLVLGVGYLAKAAMFPIGFLFLLACIPWTTAARFRALPTVSLGLAVFLATCAPFVMALSWSKGRLTFGDSGRINYAEEISGVRRVSHWQGGPQGCGTPVHATTPIREHPEVFAFDSGPGGSYPVWTDPSYWYEGVRFHVDIRRQIENLVLNTAAALCTFLVAPGALTALLALLFLRRRRAVPDLGHAWFLALPCAGAVFLYCVVLISTRYVSMFLAVVGLVCLGAAHLEGLTRGWRRFLAVTAIATMLGNPGLLLVVRCYADAWDLIHLREMFPNRYWLLAEEARRVGLQRGSRVGYIGVTTCAYWLHVAGAQVIVEVPMIADLDRGLTSTIHDNMREIDAFWRADKAVRHEVLEAMRARGAAMVFADRVPSWAPVEGWTRFQTLLPMKSEYFATWVYLFPETHAGQRAIAAGSE